jgi:hypothetical protein
MADNHTDIDILRELVRKYLDVVHRPGQEMLREEWSRHNSLEQTRVPILVSVGMWNAWLRRMFPAESFKCADPVFRQHEEVLRLALLRATFQDDTIFEPWLTHGASLILPEEGIWGVREGRQYSEMDGGAFAMEPPLKELADIAKLKVPSHKIDEEKTAQSLSRICGAVGDLIEIDIHRDTAYSHFNADISTRLAQMRGLEQVMLDMYENPQWLHRFLAFMRDGIVKAQQEAEDAGDYSLTCNDNQSMPYAKELEAPRRTAGRENEARCGGFPPRRSTRLSLPRCTRSFC